MKRDRSKVTVRTIQARFRYAVVSVFLGHNTCRKIHDSCIIIVVQGSNLYVKNLANSVDDKALQELFSPCGEVVSAKVMRYPNGTSKGFGFVSYSSREAGDHALLTLRGADPTRDY